MPSSQKWLQNGFGKPAAHPQPRWTDEDTALLEQTMRDACASYQMTTSDMFDKKIRKEKLGKDRDGTLWMEIAQKFPQRQVMSVYKKAQRLYLKSGVNNGKWTTEETNQLLQLVQSHGTKWSKIGPLLNRPPDSCADHYRVHQAEYQSGKWTSEETDKLQKLVKEFQAQHAAAASPSPKKSSTTANNTEEPISSPLPWTAISRRLGTRAHTKCREKWQSLQEQANRPNKDDDNLPPKIKSTRKRKRALPTKQKATKAKRPSKKAKETKDMTAYANIFADSDEETVTDVDNTPTRTSPSDYTTTKNDHTELPSMMELFAMLNEIFLTVNLNTDSINDILEKLESQLPNNNNTPLPAKTRKILQHKIRDMAVEYINPRRSRYSTPPSAIQYRSRLRLAPASPDSTTHTEQQHDDDKPHQEENEREQDPSPNDADKEDITVNDTADDAKPNDAMEDATPSGDTVVEGDKGAVEDDAATDNTVNNDVKEDVASNDVMEDATPPKDAFVEDDKAVEDYTPPNDTLKEGTTSETDMITNYMTSDAAIDNSIYEPTAKDKTNEAISGGNSTPNNNTVDDYTTTNDAEITNDPKPNEAAMEAVASKDSGTEQDEVKDNTQSETPSKGVNNASNTPNNTAKKAESPKERRSSVKKRQAVSDIQDILRKTPKHSMKKKALQKAIQTKYSLSKEKEAKKLLKKALKKHPQLKLDGKVVTLIS